MILSFEFGEILATLKFFVGTILTRHPPDPEKLIQKMRKMADACRKEGLSKLQAMLDDPDISGDSFLPLREGMILTLNIKPAEEIASTMTTDLGTCTVKGNMEIEVFMAAGGFSPTLGITDMVMDLIQVLSNMTGAAVLTASIAVAFSATPYSVLFASLLYFPMVNRVKTDLRRQKVCREMMIESMCLVASGKSTRNVENQLSLYYHVFKNGQKKYKEGISN